MNSDNGIFVVYNIAVLFIVLSVQKFTQENSDPKNSYCFFSFVYPDQFIFWSQKFIAFLFLCMNQDQFIFSVYLSIICVRFVTPGVRIDPFFFCYIFRLIYYLYILFIIHKVCVLYVLLLYVQIDYIFLLICFKCVKVRVCVYLQCSVGQYFFFSFVMNLRCRK